MAVTGMTRRGFLTTTGALAAAGSLGFAGEPPAVTNPRATDGDDAHQPDWDERLTITVGPKDADLVGSDDKVIQAAIDYVARLGAGTVKLLPGTFTLRNSIYLPSRLRLIGSGADTIITKGPSETVAISADSDWYDQEITLTEAADFRVGDGVTITTIDPHNGG